MMRKDIPAGEQEQREVTDAVERLGRQILSICRDELYFSMRFMDVALSSFAYQMDSGVSPFGTDGYTMYFHPRELGGLYRENRILANRGYLHMVLHCVFRHIVKPEPGQLRHAREGNMDQKELAKRYWNVSCDIAAEHIIDGCDLRPVRWSRTLLRRETYRKLEDTGHLLNAERIFFAFGGQNCCQRGIPVWRMGLRRPLHVETGRLLTNRPPV